MIPRFSFNNTINSPHIYSVDIRNFLIPKTTNSMLMNCSYFSYILIRKLSIVHIASKAMSFLFDHIHRILFWSSQKKMARIYAGWVITFMTYKFTFWDIPKMQNPRISMGCFNFAKSCWSKISVSVMSPRCNPIPTSISFFNFFPKLFLWWNSSCFKSAIPTFFCSIRYFPATNRTFMSWMIHGHIISVFGLEATL